MISLVESILSNDFQSDISQRDIIKLIYHRAWENAQSNTNPEAMFDWWIRDHIAATFDIKNDKLICSPLSGQTQARVSIYDDTKVFLKKYEINKISFESTDLAALYCYEFSDKRLEVQNAGDLFAQLKNSANISLTSETEITIGNSANCENLMAQSDSVIYTDIRESSNVELIAPKVVLQEASKCKNLNINCDNLYLVPRWDLHMKGSKMNINTKYIYSGNIKNNFKLNKKLASVFDKKTFEPILAKIEKTNLLKTLDFGFVNQINREATFRFEIRLTAAKSIYFEMSQTQPDSSLGRVFQSEDGWYLLRLNDKKPNWWKELR